MDGCERGKGLVLTCGPCGTSIRVTQMEAILESMTPSNPHTFPTHLHLVHTARPSLTQVRQTRYDFDEAALKPYLSLDAITAAVFDVAGRLFGLSFVRRADIKAYHEDVIVYEVWGQ